MSYQPRFLTLLDNYKISPTITGKKIENIIFPIKKIIPFLEKKQPLIRRTPIKNKERFK